MRKREKVIWKRLYEIRNLGCPSELDDERYKLEKEVNSMINQYTNLAGMLMNK